MKNKSLLAAALFALGLTACNQAPPPPDAKALADAAAAQAAKDVADIKALEDNFIKATIAKDVDKIMSAYVPGSGLVVFDLVPPRQYVGADAYRKDWVETLGLIPGAIDASISDLDVTATGGDIAYGHSIQHFGGKMKDGKMLDLNVRVTDGYKKVNGQWLIAHEHVSIPVDLATMKPDPLSKP